MDQVEFGIIPAVKLGKLAIDNKYKGKGYGDFLINMAIGIIDELTEIGIACRFLTVDADIRNGDIPLKLYSRNGFVLNEKANKNRTESLSMRLDLFSDEFEDIAMNEVISE